MLSAQGFKSVAFLFTHLAYVVSNCTFDHLYFRLNVLKKVKQNVEAAHEKQKVDSP